MSGRNNEDSNHYHNHEPSRMPQGRVSEGESNPFVAFRRFADEQVSSMLQSITGLPSSVSTPPSGRWNVFAPENGYQNMMYRQGSGADHATEQNYSAKEGGAGGSAGDGDNSDDTDINTYATWPLNYLYFSPYSPLHLELSDYEENRRGVFSSLMSAFQPPSNPSSSEHEQAQPQWREAFEDLLRLENGKPMLERPALRNKQHVPYIPQLIRNGSLSDQWKLVNRNGLACPEYFPARTPSKSSASSHTMRAGEPDVPTDKQSLGLETEAAQNELDLYDRFLHDVNGLVHDTMFPGAESSLLRMLGGIERLRGHTDKVQRKLDEDAATTEAFLELIMDDFRQGCDDTGLSLMDLLSAQKSVPETPQAEHPAPPNKPTDGKTSLDVVFNRSHTERKTRPDGSIWCKTTITKRYADGREETDESVDVHHPQSEKKLPVESTEKSKGGWFWKD